MLYGGVITPLHRGIHILISFLDVFESKGIFLRVVLCSGVVSTELNMVYRR